MAFGWLRPVLPAGALLLTLLAALVALWRPVHADPNEVSIVPSAVEIAPGDSTTVQLVADTPAATLSAWAIDVRFDPEVVTTTSRDCDPLDQPPNTTAVGYCLVQDLDEDGVDETVQEIFALIFNDDGSGLSGQVVLADITFEAVGDPGQCTDLRLFIRLHADADGNETDPLLFDGQICIEEDAPPSGTSVPHTPAARTSDPTPVGGGDDQPVITLDTDEPGATENGDESPAGDSRTPGPGETMAPTSPGDGTATGPAISDGGDDDDGGGPGIVFWIVLGLGGLFVAAALAWALVRNFSRGSGPPDGPSAG